ncbi:MAG: metallophosphoesterase [Candidatus Margulisiibacteriota bacterium]
MTWDNWNLRMNPSASSGQHRAKSRCFAVPILKEPRRLVSGSLIYLILSFSFCYAFSQTPQPTTTTTIKAIPEQVISTSATNESFSFIVFGDNRDGDKTFKDLVERVRAEAGVDFIVNTGDFVSNGEKKQYNNYLGMVSKLKPKLYHVPGNHDLVKGGDKYFKKYFGPLYYSFDYKNSHFIVLNNAFKGYFDAQQFQWLKKDLAKTGKDHIFVFMHRPVFDPSEIYKNYVMSGREVTKQLMALFEKYQVDYVIAGHIHGYARAERRGIVYVVSGGAGAPLYLPADFGGFYHYVRIDVNGEMITDRTVKIYD